jgi:hypothetical protein
MSALSPNAAAFAELTRELRRIREFVEPTDANGGTYSQRIFGLLIATCEQFERTCRLVLVSKGHSKEAQAMGPADYATLAASHGLPGSVVTAHFWRPKAKKFRPFKEWSDPSANLPWLVDYGILKHTRHAEYRRANLLTLVEAMSGLFLLLCRTEMDPTSSWRCERHENHWHCQDGDNFTTECLPQQSLDDTQPAAPSPLSAPFPIRCSNPKCLTMFEPEANPRIGDKVRCPRCDWDTTYDRRRGDRRGETPPEPPK